MNIKRLFFLSLYYGIAKHMPASNVPWSFGAGKLRRLCAQNLFKKCGANVNVEKGVYFGNGSNIEIGDNSGIGIRCHVPNDVIIGKNVMMGPDCFLLERLTHNIDRIDISIREQGLSKIEKRTIIGDDVWIGRQVLIMPGKNVGSHTVIGAGSVVSKDVPDYAVAAGNPVRIIRDRRKE